jgi:hypothetical protein
VTFLCRADGTFQGVVRQQSRRERIKERHIIRGRDGLYELAVLGKTVNGYDLDYSTSVTDNVVGYLEWPDIEKLLLQVQALPPRNLQDPIK